MAPLRHILWLSLALVTGLKAIKTDGLLPNVKASFGGTAAPFDIDVHPDFIEQLRDRVRDTRLPVQVLNEKQPGSDGPIIANATDVRDFWVEKYDWEATQASINGRLKQFTTTVQIFTANYSHPVPLHFVHHRSSRVDAIPLIFVHGWPGSFLEVENIIDRLTDPPNSSVPAFHVVAPSIPGFGFCPAPVYDGFGATEAATAFNALMLQLNYTKYVYQGGDLGGIIFAYQATQFPDNLISGLSNFWLIGPTAEDLARYRSNQTTPDETAYIKNLQNYVDNNSGYRIMQQTRPLTLAYALADSPLGFTMWIYGIMREAVDPRLPPWTPDQIITWALMYLIQGPYAGLRIYKEEFLESAFAPFEVEGGLLPYVKQPVAISEFPFDLWYRLPLEWAKRGGDVRERYVHEKGRHFAAWQTPEVLAEDMWRWFGDRERSGTEVFYD